MFWMSTGVRFSHFLRSSLWTCFEAIRQIRLLTLRRRTISKELRKPVNKHMPKASSESLLASICCRFFLDCMFRSEPFRGRNSLAAKPSGVVAKYGALDAYDRTLLIAVLPGKLSEAAAAAADLRIFRGGDVLFAFAWPSSSSSSSKEDRQEVEVILESSLHGDIRKRVGWSTRGSMRSLGFTDRRNEAAGHQNTCWRKRRRIFFLPTPTQPKCVLP